MIPASAWGELLIVGAVPVAAAVAIVAGISARRRPRLARALVAVAAFALVGMMITGRRLSQPLNELRKQQTKRFEPLAVGWSREQVEASLGAPDLECPGEGAYEHRVRGTTELLKNLYGSTAERWIYFIPGAPEEAPRPECQPRYADGEVGFNAQGKVIWFIELTDETFLTF